MARTRNEQCLRYISGACMRVWAMPLCDNGMARRARWMESLEHLKESLLPEPVQQSPTAQPRGFYFPAPVGRQKAQV
jgi:hypothetical protein